MFEAIARRAMLPVAFGFAIAALAQHVPPDPDPPPGVLSYKEWKKLQEPKGGKRSGNKASAESRDDRDRPDVVRRLTAFTIGRATHPGSFSFCEQVAADIDSAIRSGERVARVVVIGSADGVPNDGLTTSLSDVSPACLTGVGQPIRDPELAFLRGCTVRKQLAEILSAELPGDVQWQRREYDEPDTGKEDDELRSVQVLIFFAERP